MITQSLVQPKRSFLQLVACSLMICASVETAQCMTQNLQVVSECVNLHVIVSNWWYLTGKCVSWLVVQIRQSKHMLGAPSFAVKLQEAARSCKIKSNSLMFGSPSRENLESGWCPCVVCWGVYWLLFPSMSFLHPSGVLTPSVSGPCHMQNSTFKLSSQR